MIINVHTLANANADRLMAAAMRAGFHIRRVEHRENGVLVFWEKPHVGGSTLCRPDGSYEPPIRFT